jgi:isopentenyl diphosphate isomerase/L-lactate dehydrogenase-like FMN-dependent dehydrogenase
MDWQKIKKIRENTKLKIILKGIMHPEDARIAKNFCDAIWVSNHGGRQLDTVAATIDILPLIRAAVGKETEVYVDGGVRSGNDIFKCIALGADYVFVGRPVAYSLLYG